jgi:outer membrane receptor protein involved in Fe transport
VLVDRQNDNISISGKSGVMVIINGKQNRMPIAAAMQMLDAMNADNVKRIEIITTPPAKYDAEGDAGIINIVLKKNKDFGTNGSFTLGAGVSSREKMNASLNLNHHVDKVNYFGTYSVNYNNLRQNINSYRRYMDEASLMVSDAKSDRAALVVFQNVRMGFDYTITSKTTLSALAAGYLRDWEMDAVNNIIYTRDGNYDRTTELDIFELSKWIHGMGNINLQHHFEEDKILDINFDYLNYYNDNPSDYTVENIDDAGNLESGEAIEVDKTTPIDIFVGMVDYSGQISPNIKMEVGVKGTFTQFNNDVGVSYFTNGSWNFDPELTNMYSLKEDISAAYSSFTFKLGEMTSMVAGLRYEYMNSVLSSETEEGILDLHYGELFPTFYISHKLNEKNTLQFSYGRRIDRPTFNELAPFIVFMTPETFIAGNENLLPAFSNNYKADYMFKSISLSVSYTDTKNAISRFQPQSNEDGTKQYFISRNFDSSENLSVMFAIPLTVNDWWTMQNNFNWVKSRMSTTYDDVEIEISQGNYRINSVQSFLFSEWFSAEVSGYYQSKSTAGVYVRKPVGKIDLGMQWKMKNGNSRFNLNFSDVFKTNIFRSVADVPELNIYSSWELDFEPRVLRLSFTHNFGNTSAKRRERNTASEEERRRVAP